MVVRQGGWTALTVAKSPQIRAEKWLGTARDLLKQAEWQTKKESTYSFLGGKERWWWWWWWSWWSWWRSENHSAITELCNSNGEYLGSFPQDSVFIALPSYQHRGVGTGNRQPMQDSPRWVSAPSQISILLNRAYKLHNYSGEDEQKPIFSISGDAFRYRPVIISTF